MVSMERELNKLFNDTNYNKENVIIREIWSIKLELQNFFEEFIKEYFWSYDQKYYKFSYYFLYISAA